MPKNGQDAVLGREHGGVFATKQVRNDLLNDAVVLRELACQVSGKVLLQSERFSTVSCRR
jgi:hypothetical protein